MFDLDFCNSSGWDHRPLFLNHRGCPPLDSQRILGWGPPFLLSVLGLISTLVAGSRCRIIVGLTTSHFARRNAPTCTSVLFFEPGMSRVVNSCWKAYSPRAPFDIFTPNTIFAVGFAPGNNQDDTTQYCCVFTTVRMYVSFWVQSGFSNKALSRHPAQRTCYSGMLYMWSESYLNVTRHPRLRELHVPPLSGRSARTRQRPPVTFADDTQCRTALTHREGA